VVSFFLCCAVYSIFMIVSIFTPSSRTSGPLEDIKASDIFEVGNCGKKPTPHPVSKPTPKPTPKSYPTYSPTDYPTYKPYPTYSPTEYPTYKPYPTYSPTDYPSYKPYPTYSPTEYPTYKPYPTYSPTEYPTYKPYPTYSPTEYPTYKPYPTYSPTEYPTYKPYPTDSPTEYPTYKPYPTDSPTEYPTYKPEPTPKPTKHEECSSSLTTDMECYDGSYDAVVVDFKICDPHIIDWIGIFHASDDPHDLDEAVAWAWVFCESVDDDCEDSYDDESLDTNGYVEFIGLPDGEYRAHLIKHVYPSSSGYKAEASSGVFYVKDECVY
jgi:hypothetical protein